MREPNSIADTLSYRVLRLSNTFALYAARRYREQFGITLPEWRVMSIIGVDEPTTARDISRVLATDKGWVGLSVERLEHRGYVTRTPDERDARRILIRLSRRGREMHDAILAVARQRQRRLLATLPKGASEVLVASLDRLQIEADRMLEELSAEATRPGSAK
jgi:DNA-binding MarR family transcriptional regulator